MTSQLDNATSELTVLELAVRYLNEREEDAQKVLDCNRRGLTVVNAARPVSGEEDWIGRFLAGVHYTAGNLERLRQHWIDYDAKRVEVVSNADILQELIKVASQRRFGDRLFPLLRERGQSAMIELCRSLVHMPYVEVSEEEFEAMIENALGDLLTLG